MKKNVYFFLTLIILLFAETEINAQFTLSADIRPRAELRNGFKKPLAERSDPAFFVEQRTRLNTAFSSNKFDVFISLQDVRIWGSTTQVYKADPALNNIYAAWGLYKFNPKHAVIVGRMELDYDNARILGNLDWAAQGRSHDLVKYEYSREGVKFHLGAAFNQDHITPEPTKLANTYYGILNNYKTMHYAWLHKDWTNLSLSFLVLNNGTSAPRIVNNVTYADSAIHFSQTLGIYGRKNLGDIAFELDAYYQAGKNGAGKDISAYLLGLNVTFLKSKPNNINVGFDYVSGDKSNTAGKVESFDVLYGTHHKFYGWMDYFYVGNGHKNKGLINPFIKGKFKSGEKSSIMAHAHQFLAQSRIATNDNVKLSSNLGTELDLVYVANLAPGVVFNVGYSQMFFTKSMEFLKDVANPKSSASWAWAQIGFKPTLFTTKAEDEK